MIKNTYPILQYSTQQHGIGTITKKDLEPLKSIKRIMGYLAIQAWPFDNFDVFENLNTIDGYHQLHMPGSAALFVSSRYINSR